VVCESAVKSHRLPYSSLINFDSSPFMLMVHFHFLSRDPLQPTSSRNTCPYLSPLAVMSCSPPLMFSIRDVTFGHLSVVDTECSRKGRYYCIFGCHIFVATSALNKKISPVIHGEVSLESWLEQGQALTHVFQGNATRHRI
jgi:hypothetical protein